MKKKLLALMALIILLGLSVGVPVNAQNYDDGVDPRDPDLVYLEIRADLDETRMSKKLFIPAPYPAVRDAMGVFTGYLLPIWDNAGNIDEELYFSVCVPDRWDEEHNICIEVTSALSSAGEGNNAYRLHAEMETVEPNVEAVPLAFMSRDTQRNSPLSNLQYFCYKDWFEVDVTALGINRDDILAFRLQRIGALKPASDNLTGDLVVLHVGFLFPRGDLVDNPGDVITEEDILELIEDGTLIGGEDVEDVAIALQHCVFFTPLILFSILAFWRHNALMFMLAAGMSVITGLYWYDVYTTELGLGISILLIAYSIVCLGFAMQCIFWKEKRSEE